MHNLHIKIFFSAIKNLDDVADFTFEIYPVDPFYLAVFIKFVKITIPNIPF